MLVRTPLLGVLAALLPIAAGAVPSLLVDDFEHGLHGWRHKPNATLHIADVPGGHALRVTADFSGQAYIWFRKLFHEKPLDLRAFDGIQFRVKGGGPDCNVLLYLMTDTRRQPVRTFGSAIPVSLDADDWRATRFVWSELGHNETGRPIGPDDLAHIEEVNISITGALGGSAVLWLDDVRATRFSEEALAAVRAKMDRRTPIPDERSFFGMLDYDAVPGLAPVRMALRRNGADFAAAKLALLRHMRSRRTPRYFFDPHNAAKLTAAMRELSPSYPQHVVRLADRMLEHKYTWEGETRNLTRPIDFVQKGRQWSAVLNRFDYLAPVARVWWFTHEPGYAEEVVGMMTDWARSCPVPLVGTMGRTWSALEVGVRTHTWMRLYMSVLDSPAMTPDANYTILKSLAEHARFLSDPNCRRGLPNMVIIESTGLAELGILLPEFGEAAQWRRRGLEVLNTELRRRVLKDGAWEEVTPGYHSWVADACLGLNILADRNHTELPEGFQERFRSLYDWLSNVLKPNGHMPMLGDYGDGNAGFFMAEAALFFSDPEFKFLAAKPLPIRLVERFGADAAGRYDAMSSRTPHSRSVLLRASGLAILRTGWDENDSYLLFDFGPIWSHTHQDTLGFDLYALGRTLLWDSGVSNYDLPECRAYYRQARAHNIVLVDDAAMKLTGKPVLHNWKSTDQFDFVDAEAQFTNPKCTHRRQILFVKPRCWVVRDILRGDAPHRYERLFHVREKARVRIEEAVAIVREGNGPILEIRNVRPAGTSLSTTKGLLTYSHGGSGSRMNRPAPVVRLIVDAPSGTVDFVTVLIARSATERPPRVTVSGQGTLEVRVAPANGAVLTGFLPVPTDVGSIVTGP